jgi:hypothetical protein
MVLSLPRFRLVQLDERDAVAPAVVTEVADLIDGPRHQVHAEA